MTSYAGNNKRHFLNSASALVVRQIISLPINSIGFLCLSALLAPEDFGAFAVIQPLLTIFLLIIDMGYSKGAVVSDFLPLSASVLKARNLKIAITFSVSLALMALTWSADNIIFHFLPFIPLVALVQALRLQASSHLERSLRWKEIATTEIIEVLVYNVTVILFARAAFGAASFLIALVLRWIIGYALMELHSRKKPLSETNEITVWQVARIGLPIQMQLLIGVVNSLLNPVLLGVTKDPVAVGIVNWCFTLISLASIPFQYLPNLLTSYFAAWAREGQSSLNKVAKILPLTVATASLYCIVLSYLITTTLPFLFAGKWTNAAPFLGLLFVSNIVSVPTYMIFSALNSQRQGKFTLMLSIQSTALLTILCGIAAVTLGIEGFCLAWVLTTLLMYTYINFITGKRFQVRLPTIFSALILFPQLFFMALVLYNPEHKDFYYQGAVLLSLVFWLFIFKSYLAKHFPDVMTLNLLKTGLKKVKSSRR